MNKLIKKATAAVSKTILFAVAIVMAGLGFAFVGALALFGLAAVGLALIAAPFVGAQDDAQTTFEEQATA